MVEPEHSNLSPYHCSLALVLVLGLCWLGTFEDWGQDPTLTHGSSCGIRV